MLFVYFLSIHQSFRFSFRPSLPTPVLSEAQKSQFSLQGETVDEVRLEQNESAVRFVLCSSCTTSSVMSAVQVVISVRQFQVHSCSMCLYVFVCARKTKET